MDPFTRLAHELGNPLCAITNYAHSLEDKVAPELRPTIQSIQREVARIQRMADALIESSRPRDRSALGADVNVALRDTLRFLGEQGVCKNITIDARLDTAQLPVKGSAIDLEQTFVNLLLNAADAMQDGGSLALYTKRVAVDALAGETLRRAGDDPAQRWPRRDDRLEQWVKTTKPGDVAMIVIADSGHGVERGHEERIFEPFVTTKSPDVGTGLGLSIVRGTVSRMGGLVWVQRSREAGAAFHIVLPLFENTAR